MEAIKKQWPVWVASVAIWTILAAWAACGVWGWVQNSEGLMTGFLVALTLGAAGFAVVSIKLAAQADSWIRRLALIGLGMGCLMFSAHAGHQGLETSEALRWAPYEAQQAALAADAQVDAAIAALPAIPLSDEQGRAIGPVRTGVLVEARKAEIARLEAKRPALGAVVAKPAPRMPSELSWAMTGLVELIELFGFFAISRRSRPASGANVVGFNAGRELAKKRWAA